MMRPREANNNNNEFLTAVQAVQPVQQQYSRFAVLVQHYSQYSCTRIGQQRLYFSTAVQHSTAVQQYSRTAVQQYNSTAVQQ